MTRTVYLNGDFLPETEAKVSIFDRAFLMADGVYEVTSVLGGKLIDFDGENIPDKTVHWAIEKTGAAAGVRPLPMGAGMAWRVFTGEVDGYKDMSLTLEPADRSS